MAVDGDAHLSPSGGSGPGVVGIVARGLSGGVALGAAFRGFMRLVSTEPSFSWAGTLAIVGLVTVVALVVSIVDAVRRRARRRGVRGVVRIVGAAAFLLIAAGPGAITVPVWVLGGLAWGRRTWHGGCGSRRRSERSAGSACSWR
ncbi:hypothetical protein [Euzebya sp.]|uniref:hypothetical protein n=1 Tax=Euzebya sp. TaxID=1971409 RepID=UPI00351217D5